jgi:hypothetical protein
MARLALSFVLCCSIIAPAIGGNVITANLPANTAIVNINAMQDGSANYSGVNQDLWYQPFFTGGASGLLQYAIQPGTYSFRLTTPSLAAAQYPGLTAGQLSQMFTAWTYNSPWATDYMVFDAAAATNAALPQLFAGSPIPLSSYPGFGSATAAFDAAVSGNYVNQIKVSPGGRHTGTAATQYTFAAPQTLIFVIPDNVLGDNNGGLSVLIRPVVGVTGDYNNNGTVDTGDYAVWRKYQGTTHVLPNDPTGGTIGAAQFNTWRSNFGKPPGSGSGEMLSGAVPEPTSISLLAAAIIPALFRRRSRS